MCRRHRDTQVGCGWDGTELAHVLPYSESSVVNVAVVEGDSLDQPVDVIVNPWNRNVIPWWLPLLRGVSGAMEKRGAKIDDLSAVIAAWIRCEGFRTRGGPWRAGS